MPRIGHFEIMPDFLVISYHNDPQNKQFFCFKHKKYIFLL